MSHEDLGDVDLQRDDLRHVLISAVQEIEVLKGMMAAEGLWDEEEYRGLRRQVMLGDHWGGGPGPWRSYSYYRHTLDEAEFLKDVLGLSESEAAEYQATAAAMSTAT